MKYLYKLDHYYNTSHKGIFIESDMKFKEITDIIIGLQFYTEDFTKHGEHSCLTEEMVAYFLCEYYNCKNYDYYNMDIKDKKKYTKIDLYSEREYRCGDNYKQYIELIKPYFNTEYIKKISLYFNDDSIFNQHCLEMLSPEEILKKY